MKPFFSCLYYWTIAIGVILTLLGFVVFFVCAFIHSDEAATATVSFVLFWILLRNLPPRPPGRPDRNLFHDDRED
jgi:hypothetical protein